VQVILKVIHAENSDVTQQEFTLSTGFELSQKFLIYFEEVEEQGWVKIKRLSWTNFFWIN